MSACSIAMFVILIAGGGTSGQQIQPASSTEGALVAEASKAKSIRARKKARIRAKRAKRNKRRKKARRKPNLPAGWTWPPSKAMKKQGKECRTRLKEQGLAWRKAKRRRNVATPIVVPSMNFGGLILEPIFRKPPFVMDCHLAESLLNVGPAIVALGVTKLRFSSIHDFRRARTNGTVKKSLSRHAYGLAVDVYEIETESGSRFAVKSSYGPAAETGESMGPAPILNELEQVGNESQQFRLLLTPGNDPKSHYDHFHFEAKVAALASSRRAKRNKARKKRRQQRRRRRRNR